ncbi:MAG: hypothetical protein L0387_19920 [Acidobacteria bacterium]|nr:hypothetical protein [Acidobacteriota bacterium]
MNTHRKLSRRRLTAALLALSFAGASTLGMLVGGAIVGSARLLDRQEMANLIREPPRPTGSYQEMANIIMPEQPRPGS